MSTFPPTNIEVGHFFGSRYHRTEHDESGDKGAVRINFLLLPWTQSHNTHFVLVGRHLGVISHFVLRLPLESEQHVNWWQNEDISKRERVSSSTMITSPDSDMQQSITSNKNTFNHLQQPYISRNILIASNNSSDRHSVIYYNIRNNSRPPRTRNW